MFGGILMLTCDFNLCIYQKEGHCILDAIDINSCGICDNAIVVDLPERKLAVLKEKQLSEIDNRWNKQRALNPSLKSI